MLVTDIEYITKSKAKIYIDETCRFVLTKREIDQYKLCVDINIDQAILDEILSECILVKAKKKVMDLLVSSDRTETELRRRLKFSDFSDDIVDLAIDYVKQYNYIDNKRYIENYMAYRSEGKSIQMIKYELRQKGLPEALTREVLEAHEHNDIRNINKYINKKYGTPPIILANEKQKVINYLLRKGYEYNDIVDCVRNFETNGN